MIEYTNHAREKMGLRHITEGQIENVVAGGTRTPSFKGRHIFKAYIDDFLLSVVAIDENDKMVVITTYRNPPWEGQSE